MPLYEYKCSSCNHHYEARESFDAPSRQACPSCGNTAKRVLHAPPIVFKGSGWYITDSRKGSSATVGSGPDSASIPPTSTADGKSDGAGGNGAKPESKPAAAPTTSDD